MISKETEVEIKILSRRGLSIHGIARELGISRNTVRKYLRGDAVRPVDQRGRADLGRWRPSRTG